MKFLADAYYWLLWISGAALYDYELDELKGGGDRLTYWMRRSRARLGKWWLVAVVFTLIAMNVGLYTTFKSKRWGWFSFTLAFDLACIYLIPHILGCW